VAKFCFVCFPAQQLKGVTAQDFQGDFPVVRSLSRKNVQSRTLVMQGPIWLFRSKLQNG
jgi:hypothetical protein